MDSPYRGLQWGQGAFAISAAGLLVLCIMACNQQSPPVQGEPVPRKHEPSLPPLLRLVKHSGTRLT